ncbi:MAG: hypothetical protein KAT43_01735 [Nanoarchaeota archaeon]|nr:hypothetical protein [Nanoarchaeota archaeon]
MKIKKGKQRKLFDLRFLSSCALNDLGFIIIGILGIFNVMILGFVHTIFPTLQMTKNILAEQAAQGLSRDEAVLTILERIDPTTVILFGSIKALAILILGFLLIVLVLTFFKSRIYLSLQNKKLDKKYFKQFFVFNIFYYLIFSIVPLVILITFKSMMAAKITIIIALFYAYITPLIRIHFRPANNYFGNYITVIKKSLRSAIQLGLLLRCLGLGLCFVILYLLSSVLGLLGIVGAMVAFIIFLYLSGISRVVIFNTIEKC